MNLFRIITLKPSVFKGLDSVNLANHWEYYSRSCNGEKLTIKL